MTMPPVPPSLDGFDAKVARAETHLDAIKRALKDIAHADPDLIPGEFVRQGHTYIFRAQRDSLDPTALSPLIGDCVHNLRAALDYLVWELVPESARTGKGATAIEFPIFTDPTRYAAEAPKKIGSLPPKAQAVIETLQPFAGPNRKPWYPDWQDPALEPLAFLYELDKWDKHRSLNLTEDVLSVALVGFEQLGLTVPPDDLHILSGRFKRGAIIAGADMPNGSTEVDVYLRATYNVSFDGGGPAGGEPLIQTLDNIRQVVRRRVRPSLSRFFPKP
jgi:hypothetical protein